MFSVVLLLSGLSLVCSIEKGPQSTPFIIHGEKANPEHQKHLVRIEINENKKSICSGSILSHSWIVTSAHCITEGEHVTYTIQHFHKGKLNVIAAANNVLKKDVFPHPSYHFGVYTADIALIRTTEKIALNSHVHAIKLAKIPAKVGDRAGIAGYGMTDKHTNTVSYPMSGIMTIMKCDSTNFFSTGFSRAYFGDSGGPVVIGDHLIGIVEGSIQIGNEMIDIYMSVPAFTKWINSIIYRRKNL